MRLPSFTEVEVAEATEQLPPPPPPCSPAGGVVLASPSHGAACGDITAAVASLSELGRFEDSTEVLRPAASPDAASPGALAAGDITAGVALLSELGAFDDTTGSADPASPEALHAASGDPGEAAEAAGDEGGEGLAPSPQLPGTRDLTGDMSLCDNDWTDGATGHLLTTRDFGALPADPANFSLRSPIW